MKSKPTALSDEQLLSACRHQAQEGTAFLDTKLAEERRKVTQYYLGKAPLPMREGGSKFVSQDVYLSVETMKAEIVETFGAGSKIVQFSPRAPRTSYLPAMPRPTANMRSTAAMMASCHSRTSSTTA
ncbi:hypothetical protein ACFSHP_12035 [Novosphingobium panipatense]|uniref:portal protein n=1 Tax=Novosphingobium panipatense TaxID=428991 RepID=UPI00360A14E4